MLHLYLISAYLFIPTLSTTLNNITLTNFLRDGDTLVSAGEVFELGFFSPDEDLEIKRRYLGIWYKQPTTTRVVVWVANRESPIKDLSGTLNISFHGNPLLFNSQDQVFWTSNASRQAKDPILRLLSSGNLVLTDGYQTTETEESFLWQSFDYPSDTLLAGMKIGKSFVTPRKDWTLTSWKNKKDPAMGRFSFSVDVRGLPQVVVKNGTADLYRLGSWNGYTFTGTPDINQASNIFSYEFLMSSKNVTYSWEPKTGLTSRLVLNQSGFLERFIWTQKRSWISVYHAPISNCDHYSFCGDNAICRTSDLCFCLQGFEPRSPRNWNAFRWSDGCARKTPLDCGRNGGKDEFPKQDGLKLPDTANSWYDPRMSLEECRDKCAKNCSCTAYANSQMINGGFGCLNWFGGLKDMREYSEGGQDVYIRIAKEKSGPVGRHDTRTNHVGVVVASVILGVLFLIGLAFCVRRKMKKLHARRMRNEIGEDGNDLELHIFDMNTISKATGEFSDSNFLGKGGFGPVYKGVLPEEGTEIAVKRLSANSGQGAQEFKNEVNLIAKLQHRNLVRLLGCCIHGDERMLIYEYMPNKSLDFFIFGESGRKLLDWTRRMSIIGGIARGLLYLHQDSRLRIIHRDLKASNVLLDVDMNPKISDFGLARSSWGDQFEADTAKVVGTYGYMAPEYAVDGHFSVKSDVFSFGVLVLEIVAGQQNRGFRHTSHDLNLLGHAWKLWNEERGMELLDKVLGESCIVSEVLRCVHVGLLCVQQKPEDRPNMSNVVLMLGTDGSMVQPKQPGFYTGRNLPEASSSSSVPSGSINDISVSLIIGR